MKQLPEDFQSMMTATLGEAEYNRLAEAIDTPSPTSIRLNAKKITAQQLCDLLSESEPVQWCPDAFYLKERPQFTFDPLLHAGCYYVQEASSMFIGKILRRYAGTAPLIALDACAAPGGKSTLALSALPEGSLLVANEYVRTRSQILAENLTKWGNPNIIITNSDTKDFTRIPPLFDVIICDAPCSGEGMFRKDPKAIEDWSLDNVRLCQNRQREIVANLWQALKPGGLFIYSTCTFNQQEDEDNAAWMQSQLNAVPLALPCLFEENDKGNENKKNGNGNNGNDNDKRGSGSAGLIPNGHFFPHLVRGEGFFVAAFTKSEDDENYSPSVRTKKKKDQKGKSKPSKQPKELTQWIDNPSLFTINESSDGIFTAFPSAYAEPLALISETAHVIHYGIQLATMKGKNLQPSHSLAMSLHLAPGAFPAAEVDYNQAIAYLRTEAITLPASVPTGYVLITFKGHPLGFVKNIGNRANNLYPSEWKIKTTFVPKV